MDDVNYIIEINALDVWELTHPLSATAYKVMRKLQYLANQERFPERIHVSNRVLMSMVGCSEDSLDKARKQLINFGLIEYKGQKKMTPLYIFHYFSHNPKYNPKLQGYEQGIKQDMEQGIKQDIEQGIKQETYINKTYIGEEEDLTTGTEDMNSTYRSRLLGYCAMYPYLDNVCRPVRDVLDMLESGEGKTAFGKDDRDEIADMIVRKEYPAEMIEHAAEMVLKHNRMYPGNPVRKPAFYMRKALFDWRENGFDSIDELISAVEMGGYKADRACCPV